MMTRIIFKQTENQAVFRYENMAQFLSAWLLSLPLTIGYLYMVVILLVNGIKSYGDLLIMTVIVTIYFLLMIVTNAAQVPLLNPQWIFTARKKLDLIDEQEAVLQYGAYPICVRRRFPIQDIERLQLVKQKWGRGFGFFLYFISLANLFSLTLTLKNRKKVYLVDNETKNGTLFEEGIKLAEYLGVPFEDES